MVGVLVALLGWQIELQPGERYDVLLTADQAPNSKHLIKITRSATWVALLDTAVQALTTRRQSETPPALLTVPSFSPMSGEQH